MSYNARHVLINEDFLPWKSVIDTQIIWKRRRDRFANVVLLWLTNTTWRTLRSRVLVGSWMCWWNHRISLSFSSYFQSDDTIGAGISLSNSFTSCYQSFSRLTDQSSSQSAVILSKLWFGMVVNFCRHNSQSKCLLGGCLGQVQENFSKICYIAIIVT